MASWDQSLFPTSNTFSLRLTPENLGGPTLSQICHIVRYYFGLGGFMIELYFATHDQIQAALTDESLSDSLMIGVGAFTVTVREMKRLTEHLSWEIINQPEFNRKLIDI